MKLLEGILNGTRSELLLLAPARSVVHSLGWRVCTDPRQYTRLLHGLQRLRGRVYLEDGAINETQLTADGRHWQAADSASWHLVAVDGSERVFGCARYSHYASAVDFQQLGVRTSALARCERWGRALRAAVEQEMTRAHRLGLAFAEVGGWAVSAEKRFTSEALRIALATYALAQVLGNCVGLTTATVRHHSAQILRRIGGRPLSFGETELPSYYDPQYQCQMEVLRFDSAKPEPAFRRAIECLREQLFSVRVVAPACPLTLPFLEGRPVPAPESLLLTAAS